MIGDAAQHAAKVGFRAEPVKLGSFDGAVVGGSAVGATTQSGEEADGMTVHRQGLCMRARAFWIKWELQLATNMARIAAFIGLDRAVQELGDRAVLKAAN